MKSKKKVITSFDVQFPPKIKWPAAPWVRPEIVRILKYFHRTPETAAPSNTRSSVEPRLRNTELEHLIDQHAPYCMGKMSESDFGFENSDSKIQNMSPLKGTAGSTICQLNTSGSKIPQLSPYKGASLLRHFAHTKEKNLINRVARESYYISVISS